MLIENCLVKTLSAPENKVSARGDAYTKQDMLVEFPEQLTDAQGNPTVVTSSLYLTALNGVCQQVHDQGVMVGSTITVLVTFRASCPRGFWNNNPRLEGLTKVK